MATRRDNIVDIGAAIDGAQDAPQLADEGDIGPFGGYDDGDDLDAPPLPRECPVTCLGVLHQKCWYLDINGQIIDLDMGNRHGKNSLVGLFGAKYNWLELNFPQWSAPKVDKKSGEITEPSRITGFKQDEASRALIIECTRRGIFDPAGKIRGAGAHRSDNDALVLHLGNRVMRRRLRLNGDGDEIEYFPTGMHGDHVYPSAPALATPWPEPGPVLTGEQLRAMIATWNWKRPLLDPLLVVGAIGASYIGGALDWRPNIWITGGRGTGKSTLNGKNMLLHQLFGKGQLRSADTTAAGIRQRLRNATVPVFLDELEAEEDQRRTKSILELARVSSSGDDAHRGGQDHQAMEFTLQSVFWASSILIPPMEPQDRSRWAVCALNPLPQGAKEPDLKAARLPEMGRKILRRMVDGWPRWDETLRAYRTALSDMGHKARACDQFGTLLACADLVLYDELPDLETVEEIASLCEVRLLREVADSAEEHELCLTHMRTTMVQARGGDERESIGTWIGSAVQDMCDPLSENRYHRRLQEMGLKIVSTTETGSKIWEPGTPGFLAVANSHQAIAGMFVGKKWANGVWAQALGRSPGAVEGVKVKFARSSLTATLVPLDQVIDESEIPAAARWNNKGSEA
jgi:Predicted ATPase